MLTYFPFPYPDEWWYSVLCRYHVRSGRPRTSNTWQELYGEPKFFAIHEKLFPSIGCYRIIQQLPPDLFRLEDILCQHTLMPYYIRFYSMQQKEKVLHKLLSGKKGDVNLARPHMLDGRQGLKFCPTCYAEDAKEYGEPYWHREHQIPLMSLCPKHGCRLRLVETDMSMLQKEFLPLSRFADTASMVYGSDICSWEQALTEALFSILTLPFEVGPTEGYNNLENALKSDQFVAQLGTKNSMYGERLYQWCVNFYGRTVSEHCLLNISAGFLYSLFKWDICVPEKYALLCVLIGMTIKDLLGPELYGLDSAREKLMEYKNTNVVYKKCELAKLLGISKNRLDLLAARYHMKPFWNTKNARTKYVQVKVTEDEKQRIMDTAYPQHDTQDPSGRKTMEAIRRIILMEAERVLAEHGNSGIT